MATDEFKFLRIVDYTDFGADSFFHVGLVRLGTGVSVRG